MFMLNLDIYPINYVLVNFFVLLVIERLLLARI